MRKQSTQLWSCSTCAQPAVISHQHNTTLSLFHVVPFFPLTMFFYYYYYGAVHCGTHIVREENVACFWWEAPSPPNLSAPHTSRCSLLQCHTQHNTSRFVLFPLRKNTPPQTPKRNRVFSLVFLPTTSSSLSVCHFRYCYLLSSLWCRRILSIDCGGAPMSFLTPLIHFFY